MPDERTLQYSVNKNNSTRLKEYLSSYGDLEQRMELVDELTNLQHCTFHTSTMVNHISKHKGQYLIDYSNVVTKTQEREVVDAIILATGRLGNIAVPNMMPRISLKYRKLRYEFGIRMETSSNIGFLARLKNPDVKMIWNTSFGEVRTFCTCREGEVWNIPYHQLSAISGRSDGPKSGYSNFSLLLRFTGDAFKKGAQFFNTILALEVIKKRHVVWQTLDSFLHQGSIAGVINQNQRPWYPIGNFINEDIARVVGEDIYLSFKEAINILLQWSPDLLNPQTVVLFPTIEGTGIYPALDNNLQVSGEKIWCCGDLAGKFRGIIPAFLSGRYVGECAINAL